MQRLFLLVICSLIYRREQTIDYVTAQTVERLVEILRAREFEAFDNFGR